MNVHTVEISQLIGPSMVRRLCRSQRWFDFPQRDKQNRICRSIAAFVNATGYEVTTQPEVLTSRMYPADGLQKVVLMRNPSKQGFFYLVAVVNLESLHRQAVTVESFGSFTEERLQRCSREFDRIMADYSGIRLKTLLEWSTRRIDYAVDARHPGLAPLYVSLMKQGRIPRGMELRRIDEGSYYLGTPNKDVTINFYDKSAQLRNDRYLCANDRLMTEAYGLLRFEVQCQGRKLNHIRDLVRKRDLPYYGMKLQTFLNAEIANVVVQDYYSRSIGYQDYYTLQAVQEKIDEQRGRNDMKQRIMQFQQQVALAGSVEAAITAYRQRVMPNGAPALISGSKGSLPNVLNAYLPRYGLNPVLLPDDYPVPVLSNPTPEALRI